MRLKAMHLTAICKWLAGVLDVVGWIFHRYTHTWSSFLTFSFVNMDGGKAYQLMAPLCLLEGMWYMDQKEVTDRTRRRFEGRDAEQILLGEIDESTSLFECK